MPLFSFKGGIHLPPRKELFRATSISTIAVPHTCHYMMLDAGASFVPVVKKGDFVAEGQIIARDPSKKHPPLHASIPGRVIIMDPVQGIFIEAQGAFPSLHLVEFDHSWKSRSHEGIRQSLFDAGIFLPQTTGSDITLIVNLIDPEPNMSARREILTTSNSYLADGIEICAKGLRADRIIIVTVGRGKSDAKTLAVELRKRTFAQSVLTKTLSSKYPQSAEPLIIKGTLGIETNQKDDNRTQKIAVIGAETFIAAHNALSGKKPFCERIISLAGKDLSRPGNYKVRFGTPISHIMDECGVDKNRIEGVLIGGEMTGTVTTDYDVPVSRSTAALLFLSRKEVRTKKKYPCIRCGRCTDVCPMRLLPTDLAHQDANEKNSTLRERCISCGCCSALCPSGIPLAQMIALKGVSND
ncbi:MAG TPA: 4Fe-4S dicluster domain-containing protein [Spirochaetota bacterium]